MFFITEPSNKYTKQARHLNLFPVPKRLGITHFLFGTLTDQLMLSTKDKLKQVDWDFVNSNTTENIHSIHPYPAKFIQEIPRTLIHILGVPEGTWIFDPFCGSGATLVEAQMAGIPSVGIDLNPIACLISRVKTRPLPQDFPMYAQQVTWQAEKSQLSVVPLIPNLDHWFERDIQIAIARVLAHINHIDDEAVKEALHLALSSILVRVSNQESDTRYAAIQKDMDTAKVYSLFLNATERLWTIKSAYQPVTRQAEIICKDILQVASSEIDRPVGLVVTSPPYPNAYEYWLYHKYRMFWLGYDPIQVKQQEIGARAHYFKKNHPTEDDFRRQMRTVFTLLWTVVVKGGHVCVVIGRSKIHGRIIDNAVMLAQVATSIGFEPVANLTRRIAPSRKTFNLSYANIRTENVLVFRK